MTIHTRLHMRTGDEIQEICMRAICAYGLFGIASKQYRWATTFLTLPPNERDLEARIAA